MIVLTGDVKGMTVPWLFQSLRVNKKTGTTIFENAPAIKKVYFKNGDIIFAASNLDNERLGESLLRAGKITKAHYDTSVELLKKTNKKQGAILVELGFITPADLVGGVKHQVKEILQSLFTWDLGQYRFDGGPLPVADIIPLQMSSGNVILEGVRGLDWKIVRKILPPASAVLRPATDPSVIFQGADLSPDQRSVLALVDGKRSIEELCALSGIGDFNCMTAIFILLALRMAEQGAIKTEKEMAFAREAVRAAVSVEKDKQEKPAVVVAAASREMIEKAFAEMPHQDHYHLLGVPQTVAEQEIKKAYFHLAKLYHPDRHFDPEMSGMKDKLDTLFARINEAYQTLSDQTKRNKYDLAQQKKKLEFEEKHPEEYVENYEEKAKRAEVQFDNGMKDFKTSNYWGAVEAFTWATRLDPMKAIYFYYHGLSLERIPRRRHEAEESLKKALELDPFKADYHFALGSLYLKSDLKAKALPLFNNALQLDPNSYEFREAIKAAGGALPEEEKKGLFKKTAAKKS